MRRSRFLQWLLVVSAVVAAGCATESTDGSAASTATVSASSTDTTGGRTSASTAGPGSSPDSTGTGGSSTNAPTTDPSTSVASTSGDATGQAVDVDCRPVADLEDEAELLRWRIVNDGVMGGRSSAEADVADSVLTLTGEIVTDGGGFSSVRLALDESLGDATRLLLRLRTDGRAYEMTMTDAAPGRDRRVSHQGTIPADGGGGWEEVAVDLTALDASVFGRPVDVDPFDPALAVEVGIILADGSDGPFRLDLDWIRACS